MSRFLLALAALALSALTPSDAVSMTEGKKVALVIGNSAYVHAVTLPNPVNDGKLIAETLRSAGFQVLEGTDLNKTDMGNLLDQFTEAAYDADTAVVFYAGHGLQVDGRNYLIPVDAELQKASQLQTRTIPVEDVLNALPPDPAVGIIILDACRDNPLARTLAKALPISRSSTMGGGLAPVQASGVEHDAGGLLIAYATDPGSVAYDGKSTHSPYTTALARHLATRGLEIQSALTRVRAEVSEATSGAQRPWHNASLAREVFIGGDAPVVAAAPASTTATSTAASLPAAAGGDVDWTVEQKVWDEASKRNTVGHYELYLAQFPNGHFASVAHLNIDQLKEAGATTQVASAGTGQGSSEAASAVRTAVSVPDDVKLTPGTPQTEQAINLDKQGRIDLQLRLSALGYEIGGFDGALGARSRTAIGKWQKETGIVETTYLTPQQHLFLVVQTDPLMVQVRANYEADKAAAAKRAKQQAAKAPTKKTQPQTAGNTSTKKKQQVATKKGTQTASDGVPYKKRTKTQSDDSSGVGTFAAGALLGTAIGVAIGQSD